VAFAVADASELGANLVVARSHGRLVVMESLTHVG
jgi:hypothetical protein